MRLRLRLSDGDRLRSAISSDSIPLYYIAAEIMFNEFREKRFARR